MNHSSMVSQFHVIRALMSSQLKLKHGHASSQLQCVFRTFIQSQLCSVTSAKVSRNHVFTVLHHRIIIGALLLSLNDSLINSCEQGFLRNCRITASQFTSSQLHRCFGSFIESQLDSCVLSSLSKKPSFKVFHHHACIIVLELSLNAFFKASQFHMVIIAFIEFIASCFHVITAASQFHSLTPSQLSQNHSFIVSQCHIVLAALKFQSFPWIMTARKA